MSPDALYELITTKAAAADFIIVDVRRTGVDTIIPGAINFPAQTLYPLLPTLITLLEKIPMVIFYCSSSLGRATRCAGWFGDALPQDSKCTAYILEGGMTAWRARFEGDNRVIITFPPEGGI